MNSLRTAVRCALMIGGIVLPIAQTSAANFTWIAGGGLWSDTAFWNPVAPIGGPTTADNVFITNNLIVETVTITSTSGANAITLSDFGITPIADRIILNNGVDFFFNGGGFLNDGTFEQNGAGSDTFVQFNGSQVIAGRGDWIMSDNASNRIIGTGGQLKHGNGFGHEIKGAGQLLANTMSLWNVSTIRQQGNNEMIIDPNANGVDNDGQLIGEGAGGLRLANGTFDNAGGAILAGNGSFVHLQNATFIGGSLSSSGSGELRAQGVTINGATVSGTMRQQNSHDVTINTGLTNNATWTLESSGGDTFMQLLGSITIDGNGTIQLSNHSNNRIIGNGGEITIGAQQTIQGAGQLGANTISIVNNGTIKATEATELLVDPNANGLVQNGVLQAVGTGGLRLTNSDYTFNNAVELKTGSSLIIENSTVTGAVNVDPGEQVQFKGNTFDALVVNGDSVQANGHDSTFVNGLTSNGTWSLNSAGGDTFMQFLGNQTLGGTGEVVFSDNANNRIIGNGNTLTIGANQTVHGAGKLGANTLSLVIEGAVKATGTTELLVDPNPNGLVQNGVLQAVGSGGLRLTNSDYTFNNAVELKTGSSLIIENSTVRGTINVDAGQQVQFKGNTFDAIVVNGDSVQQNGFDSTFVNGLTSNGTWSLNSAGGDTFMQFLGNQTLGGSGEVVFSDNANNRIIGNGNTLTIGANQTVRGAGKLGANTLSLVIEGAVKATGTTELLVDPNPNGLVQNGVLQAVGSGGLRLTNSNYTFNNAVELKTGSSLIIENSTVTGFISVDAGEQVQFRGNTFDAIVVNGDSVQQNGFDSTFVNGVTNNGTWSLNSTGSDNFMQFLGNQTLGGNGEVALSDRTTNRLIGNGAQLTIGANQTVRGSGQIGANTLSLVNQGTINANGALATLTIDANTNLFENQGSLLATGAAGLISTDQIKQTAGQTVVDTTLTINSGALNLEGGTLSGSGVINGDVNNTGGTVNTGNSPGVLTINGDYDQSALGIFLVEMIDTGSFDQLIVNGTAQLGGTIDIDLLGGANIAPGDMFDVLIADDIIGTFNNSQIVAGTGIFDVAIVEGIQDIVRLTALTAAVPLPAPIWMLISACALLILRRRQSVATI